MFTARKNALYGSLDDCSIRLGMSKTSLRTSFHRHKSDPKIPKPAGRIGKTNVYMLDEIKAWHSANNIPGRKPNDKPRKRKAKT